MPNNPSKFEKDIFLNTVLIENLTDSEFGTGFVVLKPVDDKKSKVLLFSNKHVFWGKKEKDKKDAVKKIRITLHQRDSNGQHILGQTKRIVGEYKRNDPGYFDHPDPNVDVGCVNISSFYNISGLNLNLTGLGVDFFEFKNEDLVAGMGVIFLGYPSGFYDRTHSLPVMRSGIIASLPSVDFNGKPQILIDAQIFPGSSGSPVFVILNRRYKLLGLISDGVHKNLDFIEIQKTTESATNIIKIPKEWIGLGLLFTTETIKVVYDLA